MLGNELDESLEVILDVDVDTIPASLRWVFLDLLFHNCCEDFE